MPSFIHSYHIFTPVHELELPQTSNNKRHCPQKAAGSSFRSSWFILPAVRRHGRSGQKEPEGAEEAAKQTDESMGPADMPATPGPPLPHLQVDVAPRLVRYLLKELFII